MTTAFFLANAAARASRSPGEVYRSTSPRTVTTARPPSCRLLTSMIVLGSGILDWSGCAGLPGRSRRGVGTGQRELEAVPAVLGSREANVVHDVAHQLEPEPARRERIGRGPGAEPSILGGRAVVHEHDDELAAARGKELGAARDLDVAVRATAVGMANDVGAALVDGEDDAMDVIGAEAHEAAEGADHRAHQAEVARIALEPEAHRVAVAQRAQGRSSAARPNDQPFATGADRGASRRTDRPTPRAAAARFLRPSRAAAPGAPARSPRGDHPRGVRPRACARWPRWTRP